MSEVVLSIYHDTRREKNNSKNKAAQDQPAKKGSELYPVRLRVYYNYTTRFYPTGIDLTKDDFERSYLSQKPRQEFKDLRKKIIGIEARAKSVADDLKIFDFDKFEKKLLRATGSGSDVFYHYTEVIKTLNEEGRISTSSNYDLSAKSLLQFYFHKGKYKELEKALLEKSDGKADLLSILDYARVRKIKVSLPFENLTSNSLSEYERWMLKEGKSKTTVGIYLRPLRALFNSAIDQSEITKEIYPFGKNKYQIPQGRNVKKALSKEDLKKLYEYPLEPGSVMHRARAFFFFSYVTNGVNVKDIAGLKYRDMDSNALKFYRAKTINTTKGDLKPIIAPVTDYAKDVIRIYGNKQLSPDTHIFPIYKIGMTEETKHKAVQALTRSINQHIKKLAVLVGVNPDISTYFARHSFTTISVQNGASLEFIQESLGHSSMTTTMNYWGGFTDNVKKGNADKLMDFN
jgi:integrase/recombinase XerD